MPSYIVTIPKTIPGKTLIEGADTFIVHAGSEADAKAIAQSIFAGDSNALIANAVVTEIVAGTDLEGWTLRVSILDSTPVVDLSVVGGAADDLDALGTAMAVQLNLESIIAGAAYATPNLTIAAAGDSLGDRTVAVTLTPPESLFDNPQPIPGYIGAITDDGAVGDALSVVLLVAVTPALAYGGFTKKT